MGKVSKIIVISSCALVMTMGITIYSIGKGNLNSKIGFSNSEKIASTISFNKLNHSSESYGGGYKNHTRATTNGGMEVTCYSFTQVDLSSREGIALLSSNSSPISFYKANGASMFFQELTNVAMTFTSESNGQFDAKLYTNEHNFTVQRLTVENGVLSTPIQVNGIRSYVFDNASASLEVTSISFDYSCLQNYDDPIDSNQKLIESIEINYDKTSYVEFETIDLDSLKTSINYYDNSQTEINYSQFGDHGFTVKLFNSLEEEVGLNSELLAGQYKLVVSTSNVNVKDEIDITVTEEDFGVIGKETLDSLSNTFTFSDNKYTASECRSVKIFDDYFNKGTYQVNVLRGNNGNDDHMIFAYNESNKSYYSFGLNLANKLQITYFDGTKLSLVKAFNDVITEEASLAVAFNKESGAVDYYLNGSFIYSNNIVTQGDLKYGFYAGTKGCVFSNVMVDVDDTIYDNDPSCYQTAEGTINYTNNSFVVTSGRALSYHTSKTFKYGELEATFNTNDASNHAGIAFCIDNNGKTTFFREEDITYYYLCVSINGGLGLYRVANKTATLVKNINTKQFYKDENHTIKVIRDSSKTIHAFFDGAYCFSYIDRHPLKGDKFGISSSSSGVKYYRFSAKNTISPEIETINKYDVVSGSFYKNNHLIVSSERNSMLLNKTPGTLNGTIEAEISMGVDYGTGLVFRLTKPSTNQFYENESGLSYYWLDVKSNNRIIFGRFENGVVSWTIEKYMPYFMSNAAKCKIVMNSSHIYAYFSNILVFHYEDEDPLTGLYYGLRSDSKGAALYGDITFSSSTEIEQNRYLIFGHSYTQLWHRYKEDFSELGEDINDIGIGGSQTGNWSKQYKDEVTCYNPEWGIYWNGINDIDAGDEGIATNTIITNYSNCLLGIKEKVPNFKCVVLSVSRCTHEKPMARQAKITEVNEKLQELCNAHDWLVYVDVETIFCDEDGAPIDSYFVDKLHPTAAGYKLVAPLVVAAIKNYQE